MKKQKILYSIIVLSIIGFFIATYLTLVHYEGDLPQCSIEGCEKVLTSEYAVLLGVPVSLFGAVYFLSSIVLSLLVLQNSKKRIFDRLLGLVILKGAIIAIILLVVQILVIDSICMYCATSDSISIILLLLYIYKIKRT